MTGFLAAHAALWPVLLPLAGAALSAALWGRRRAQDIVCATTLLLTFAAAVLLLALTADGTVLAARFGDWDAPFGIVFVADRLGALLATTGALVIAGAFLVSLADLKRREARSGFHPLLLGLSTGVNGAFLTGDLFNLYVWFEVMLITSMGLLVLGRTRARLDAALRYGVLNLLSTLLFLLALALIYGATGTLNLADLSRAVAAAPASPNLTIAGLLLVCGFAVKAGVAPFHLWLPASYPAASPVVAAVFAALLTKVGVYALIRVTTLVFPIDAGGLGTVLAILAAATMLLGVLGALSETDLSRILAWQVVSQIGLILTGLALSTPEGLAGAVFYMTGDILTKGALFLGLAAILRAAGSSDLRDLGGLAGRAPLLALLFALPALSLAGLPPLAGFWGKLMLLDAMLRGGLFLLAAVALVASLGNILSMGSVWGQAFWKEPRRKGPPRAVPPAMLAGLAILSAATLAIGLYPEPLAALSRGIAADLLDPAAYVATSLPAPPEARP